MEPDEAPSVLFVEMSTPLPEPIEILPSALADISPALPTCTSFKLAAVPAEPAPVAMVTEPAAFFESPLRIVTLPLVPFTVVPVAMETPPALPVDRVRAPLLPV